MIVLPHFLLVAWGEEMKSVIYKVQIHPMNECGESHDRASKIAQLSRTAGCVYARATVRGRLPKKVLIFS